MNLENILGNIGKPQPRRRGRGSLKNAEKGRKNSRARKARPKHSGIYPDQSMDDTAIFNPTSPGSDDVIFGVYGVDEWITNSYTKHAIERGENTLCMEGTWLTPAGWNLPNWVMATAKRFNFMSKNRAVLFFDWGIVEAVASRGKLELELNGIAERVVEFVAACDATMKHAENLIEWVYDSRGSSISVPLNYRPALVNAYPWLNKNVYEYIDDYLNSSASVLILLGPPGTGKTTFIKNLIHRSGSDAKVTYDEKIMNDDSLFANFVESDTRFMIMEDADTFLGSRTDGNTMMHRFLNVSDGLISAEGKKLVFSTNLPSVRDIDSALMRPGRCFDVVEFRPLTRTEACAVAEEAGRELRDGDTFSLAEIFDVQPICSPTRGVGFL